jgi:hypothetical protein
LNACTTSFQSIGSGTGCASRLLKNSTLLQQRHQGPDFFVPMVVGKTKSALGPRAFSGDFAALGSSFGLSGGLQLGQAQ